MSRHAVYMCVPHFLHMMLRLSQITNACIAHVNRHAIHAKASVQGEHKQDLIVLKRDMTLLIHGYI